MRSLHSPYSTLWNMLYIDTTWTSTILMVHFWTSYYRSLDSKASKCQRQRPASILSQALWYPHTALAPQLRITITHSRLVKEEKMREMDCEDKSNCNAQFRVILWVGWKDAKFTLYLQTSLTIFLCLVTSYDCKPSEQTWSNCLFFFLLHFSIRDDTNSALLLTKPRCPISKTARIIFLHLRRAPQK